MTASWSGSPKTWTAGALTAAELNAEVRDRLDWIKAALLTHGIVSDSSVGELTSALYGARIRRTTDQTIATGVSESIQFTSEDADSHAFHSLVSNTQRITVPSGGDGWYSIGGGVQFAADNDGSRVLFLEVNGIGGAGTQIPGSQQRVPAVGSATTQLVTSAFYELNAGDYIALTTLHDAGNNLAISSATFWAFRQFAS